MVLTSLGGRIHAVPDGCRIRAVLSEEEIDIVVSDDRMPIQSGLEALMDIRLAGNAVPFLLITAFGGEVVRAAAARMGAEVLDKPFAASELVDRVRRMCGLPTDA